MSGSPFDGAPTTSLGGGFKNPRSAQGEGGDMREEMREESMREEDENMREEDENMREEDEREKNTRREMRGRRL